MSEPVRVSGAELWLGDCRDVLAGIPAESVHACVTSPPYWGLRDYQVAGQIGLEASVAEYVADLVGVFREVRRVLRPDGVVFLNLGDAYSDGGSGANGRMRNSPNANRDGTSDAKAPRGALPRGGAGLKPKDLIGLPWLVAKALQEPFYLGKIKRERDRAWLAGILDGEGTICGSTHVRKDDGRTRTTAHVFVTNSCEAMLDECARIWPASRYEHNAQAGEGHLGKKAVHRWMPNSWEHKADILAELYPYLITKKKQALVAWNLLQLVGTGKRDGHSDRAQDARDKRLVLTGLLGHLNAGEIVDLPTWLRDIPAMFEQGWWLRSDIIWSKLNPMPESVTDRPTKSHEYVFLLSKSATYHFDQEAVREPGLTDDRPRSLWDERRESEPARRGDPGKSGHKTSTATLASTPGRNLRSVWTISTQPFSEAHFATMPPALAERCIKAGCPAGGTVLDPFAGAGTTLLVAERLQRRSIGIELNPAYVEMAARRLRDDASLFAAPPGPAPGREEVAASVAEDQKALL